jgi:hypothetical protein
MRGIELAKVNHILLTIAWQFPIQAVAAAKPEAR